MLRAFVAVWRWMRCVKRLPSFGRPMADSLGYNAQREPATLIAHEDLTVV